MSEGYNVILADPPWHYNNYAAKEPGMMHDRARGPNKYYPTMTVEDIGGLSVPSANSSVLFMWATWPLLPEAFEVIRAWGFEYKTLAWVWVKANKGGLGFFTGMGYYTRANSEPCLLAVKGKPDKPANRGIQALIYSAVRAHSKKPQDQYRKIEALYPSARYLELFARRTRPGWDVWGNEVDSNVKLEVSE